MALKYDCTIPNCRKQVTATKNQRYRTHTNREGDPCPNSSDEIPEHILAAPVGEDDRPEVPREGIDFAKCVSCDRNVKLTKLGYFEDHTTTLMGGERCPTGGVRAKHAKRTVTVADPAGVISDPEKPTASPHPIPSPAATSAPAAADASIDVGEANLARTPMDAYLATLTPGQEVTFPVVDNSPESTDTPPASNESDWDASPYGKRSGSYFQPGSPYLQPPEWTGSPKPEPMSGLAADIATMVKETFYSYSNRKTTDNRTAQTTLGPSEVGTPCDRRLAMELLNVPYVNPGGDGWAAWVGTQMHDGMAQIYTFADAGTGRYRIEFPVRTPSPWVPKGTSDLFDRRIFSIIDWKMMGKYSLDKFRLEGPSETYEVQGHVYGLGAEEAGEKVRNIAVVGLPRAGSSLDEMHVWAAPYDRKRAIAALERVDRIAGDIENFRRNERALGGQLDPLKAARTFDAANDCRYCPFFRKKDTEMEMGCPGV